MLDSPGVRRRIWLWAIVGLAGFLIVAAVTICTAIPLTSDALRHRMIDTLSDRLDADVALGDLHWRMFPTVDASGSSRTIRRRGRTDSRPLISIERFTVDVRLAGLLRKRVWHLTVEGIEIASPPDDIASPEAEARDSRPAA